MLFSAGWEYSYCVVHLFFNNLLSVILFQKPVWDTLWTGELPQHPTSSHFSFYSHATPSSLSWHTRIHTAKAKETRINVQTKTSLFPKISFSPDAFLDLVHINIYPPSHRNSSLKLHQQLEAETEFGHFLIQQWGFRAAMSYGRGISEHRQEKENGSDTETHFFFPLSSFHERYKTGTASTPRSSQGPEPPAAWSRHAAAPHTPQGFLHTDHIHSQEPAHSTWVNHILATQGLNMTFIFHLRQQSKVKSHCSCFSAVNKILNTPFNHEPLQPSHQLLSHCVWEPHSHISKTHSLLFSLSALVQTRHNSSLPTTSEANLFLTAKLKVSRLCYHLCLCFSSHLQFGVTRTKFAHAALAPQFLCLSRGTKKRRIMKNPFVSAVCKTSFWEQQFNFCFKNKVF